MREFSSLRTSNEQRNESWRKMRWMVHSLDGTWLFTFLMFRGRLWTHYTPVLLWWYLAFFHTSKRCPWSILYLGDIQHSASLWNPRKDWYFIVATEDLQRAPFIPSIHRAINTSLNVLCLKKEHLWRRCTHPLCFLQHRFSCLHRINTQVVIPW